MSWLDTLEDIRKKDFTSATKDERDKAARDVVNMASYACAVVAVSPIPFSDAVLMLPVQSAMVMTIGHVYGRKLTQADAKDLILELGTTAGIGMLARQGIKALLPVVGALLTVPAAFAANWGIGRVAMEYFRNPGMPKEQLKKVYDAAKEEGSKLFSKERFDAFRKSSQAPKVEEEQDDEQADDEGEPRDTESTAPKKAKVKKKVVRKSGGAAAAPKSAVAKIVENDFEHKLAANPGVRSSFGGLVHLDISGAGGGQWTVDMARPSGFSSPGLKGSPKLTIRCSADDFVALLAGKKNAQMAVLSGDLQLEPMDLDLAMKLGPLFS